MPKRSSNLKEIRKKISILHEQTTTSHHEASHALFALLNGMEVYSVCIFEHPKLKRIHGLTHYNSPDLTNIEDAELFNKLLINEIKMQYAGSEGEKYHFKLISGSNIFPMVLYGASDDFQAAAKLIKEYNLAPPGRKRYLYKQKIKRETLRQLKEYWDDLVLIAHSLFKYKKLTSDDLHRLLTTKSKNKAFWKEQFKMMSSYYLKQEDEDKLKSIVL